MADLRIQTLMAPAMLALALGGCDSRESKFVEKCKRSEPKMDCKCIFKIAKANLSDEFLTVFVEGVAANSRAGVEKAARTLSLIDQPFFVAKALQVMVMAERQCRR